MLLNIEVENAERFFTHFKQKHHLSQTVSRFANFIIIRKVQNDSGYKQTFFKGLFSKTLGLLSTSSKNFFKKDVILKELRLFIFVISDTPSRND